jgi:hypothetical protein
MEVAVADRSLEELEALRVRLYEQLATSGDFRRGSVSENYRRCGKPGCHCALPGDPGHGPRFLWTRTRPGGRGSTGRQLSPEEVEKVRRELANYHRFAEVSERIVEVNEAICEARPPDAAAQRVPSAGTSAEKGGSTTSSRRSSRRR